MILTQNTDELTKFVRSLHAYSSSSIPSTKKMTREEKLHKCVAELVDTERTYVKVRRGIALYCDARIAKLWLKSGNMSDLVLLTWLT